MRAFHILIVEDNESIKIALATLLRKLSFNNIDLAPNGYEALKLLITRHYDLIFLDNLMPVMSGLEFLRRCKSGAILDWTTVMMVTAATDSDTVTAIRDEALKVDEFVIKPLDFKVISSKIDRLLRSDRNSPVQRLIQIDSLSDTAQKGSFLSISTKKHDDTVTIQMFGFFLNDDRKLVKDLPDVITSMTETSISIDLRNVLMIDEFGLGMLLLMNGVATMAGKQFEMMLDEKTVGTRLTGLGLPLVIPVRTTPDIE